MGGAIRVDPNDALAYYNRGLGPGPGIWRQHPAEALNWIPERGHPPVRQGPFIPWGRKSCDPRSAAVATGTVEPGVVDGLLVFDAADEEPATAAMLHLASFGNVHTQTARAYRSDEMAGIVAKL